MRFFFNLLNKEKEKIIIKKLANKIIIDSLKLNSPFMIESLNKLIFCKYYSQLF